MRALIISFVVVSFFAQMQANAEESSQDIVSERERVSIIWQDYRSFNDVKPVNQGRTKFAKHVFNELSDYFAQLASELPDGQRFEITVTNLDLAGQVFPASFVGLGSGGQDVRLVKDVHIPRMDLSWRILDANGVQIKAAEDSIKDMSFNQRHNPFFSHEFLRYEKNMLRSWFKRNIVDNVAQN
ncbi:MAG: DUF3016 domain-containing protein [Alteromonadaceae bacterium]|nr:DUF3016 domain-containing protein [Alteromonadaceae bacterium]